MRIACQTTIFGETLSHSLPEAFRMLRSSGFSEIEVGPMILGGRSTSELGQLLADQEIHLCAMHCGINMLTDLDKFRSLCRSMTSLQCNNIICSGILSGGASRRHYKATGRLVAERTQKAKSFGIRLSYHHHDWELTTTFGNRLGLQILMEEVGRETGLVIDIYWARAADMNWAPLWDRYSDRCRIVYLADGNPVKHSFSALGEGKVNVVDAFDFFFFKRLDYIVWKQDFAEEMPIQECIEISSRWLKGRLEHYGYKRDLGALFR